MGSSHCVLNSLALHTSGATCGGLLQNSSRCPKMRNRCLLQSQRAISTPLDASCYRFFVFVVALLFATKNLQVMTGRPPYADIRGDHQVTVLILRGRKPGRPLNPHIEDSFWELIEKCWSDLGNRPSAVEVLSFFQSAISWRVCTFPLLMLSLATTTYSCPQALNYHDVIFINDLLIPIFCAAAACTYPHYLISWDSTS
jgi:hypothetical protein